MANKRSVTGGVVVGCLLLGVGIGMWLGTTGVGAVIGLGSGFILSVILYLIRGKW